MKPRIAIIGGLVAAFIAGLAVAQTLITVNLSGNEAVLAQIGGPGGGGIYTTTAVLRNTTGFLAVPGTGTVGTSLTNLTAKACFTSQITTWNVQFHPSLGNGEMVENGLPRFLLPATVSMATLAPATTITGSASPPLLVTQVVRHPVVVNGYTPSALTHGFAPNRSNNEATPSTCTTRWLRHWRRGLSTKSTYCEHQHLSSRFAVW